MKLLKRFVKPVIFLILLAVAFGVVQQLFLVKADQCYQATKGFYKERAQSLDGVYIGASNVYAFFEPPLAWRDHGIAVFSYSLPSMRSVALKDLVAEARKTQPDALYIINVNNFKSQSVSANTVHYMADYMPFSVNKLRLIDVMCDSAGIHGLDRLEFFFPIIRFHSGWSELTEEDYTRTLNGVKGADVQHIYYAVISDISEDLSRSETIGQINPEQESILEDFLSYCEQEKVRILFVKVPQAQGEKFAEELNAVEQYVRDRGYDCLDMMEAIEEIGIRPETDFYNAKHCNVHGAVKTTEYLAQYLEDHYDFQDKRGLDGYEDWDEAGEAYTAQIARWTLPLEREYAPRDYDLAAPAVTAERTGESVAVAWSASESAEGYEIYRKSGAGGDRTWQRIAGVDGGAAAFTDEDVSPEVSYTYTVVPFRTENGQTVYGSFDVSGVTYAAEED